MTVAIYRSELERVGCEDCRGTVVMGFFPHSARRNPNPSRGGEDTPSRVGHGPDWGLIPPRSACACLISQTERKTAMEKMSIETLYELKARMERRGRRDGVRYANCVRELRIRGLSCPLR